LKNIGKIKKDKQIQIETRNPNYYTQYAAHSHGVEHQEAHQQKQEPIWMMDS
jgi:hypothetical protein